MTDMRATERPYADFSEITFTVGVGALSLGNTRREIKRGAAILGLRCEIEEDRGRFLARSLLIVRVSGEPTALDAYVAEIQKWAEEDGAA